MTVQEVNAFLGSFTRSGAPVTDLHRIGTLLERLGDPQKHMQFVHIAGTNGKGSVAEYCTWVLRSAGIRTGTFTSPYIRHYRDRIRLDGADIPEEALCRLCERTAAVCKGEPFSQFEITLAIALLYFAEEKTELVVLETGIGGRMDATNIIPPPVCAVITSVSMDHMQVLGSTIAEIAAQKAGILKSGSTAVLSPMKNREAAQVIGEAASRQGCPIRTPDKEACRVLACGITGNRFVYKDTEYTTQMGGNHQIDNALTVIEAVEILREKGYSIPREAVCQGLSKALVPARIQVLQTDPPVLLDGGHNADGVGALVDLLSESGTDSWIGICGMTNTKDANAAAFQLSLVLNRVLCVDGFTETALSREELVSAFTRQHAMASPMALADALPYALKWAKGSGGGVVICGSLYLAAHYLNMEDAPWSC